RTTALAQIEKLANSVSDQQTADSARAAIPVMMQQYGFSRPEIAHAIEVAGKPGDPFDQDHWNSVIRLGQTYNETLTSQHQAIQNIGDAYKNADSLTTAHELALKRTIEHLMLNPAQYQNNRALAVAVEPSLAQLLPPQWNQQTAQQLTGYLEGQSKAA